MAGKNGDDDLKGLGLAFLIILILMVGTPIAIFGLPLG